MRFRIGRERERVMTEKVYRFNLRKFPAPAVRNSNLKKGANTMSKRDRIACFSAGLALLAPLCAIQASADVRISSDPTENMTCSGGVCSPTAETAVLNVADLSGLLASGDVTVNSAGSGVNAYNIVIAASLSWTSASALTLNAGQDIRIEQPVTVIGNGGLTLTYDKYNRDLYFTRTGNVQFWDASSSLTINRIRYTLAADLPTLAREIAARPQGHFALAKNYDASVDGTYPSTPIPRLEGVFEGLNNTISNLRISDTEGGNVGLFGSSHNLRDIGLIDANVSTSVTDGSFVGALAGSNSGQILNAYSTGSVSAPLNGRTATFVGGLVGHSSRIIRRSYSTASASGPGESGGLVGKKSQGIIDRSFAAGAVTGQYAGGLAGFDNGPIENSFALAPVSHSGSHTYLGGLVGQLVSSTVRTSYSAGAVDNSGNAGGFAGDYGNAAFHCYWDMDASGHKHGTAFGDVRGVKGLTTSMMKSGLPEGFDPAIWASDPNVNGGYPYLIANPPPGQALQHKGNARKH
jgi:hypothetical protein